MGRFAPAPRRGLPWTVFAPRVTLDSLRTQGSASLHPGLRSCAASRLNSSTAQHPGLRSCAASRLNSSTAQHAGLRSCAASRLNGSTAQHAGLRSCAASRLNGSTRSGLEGSKLKVSKSTVLPVRAANAGLSGSYRSRAVPRPSESAPALSGLWGPVHSRPARLHPDRRPKCKLRASRIS